MHHACFFFNSYDVLFSSLESWQKPSSISYREWATVSTFDTDAYVFIL